ncbi:MAG: hypothetical protein CVV49_09930 [Spirochaetae bacterium HGW-Spirochaetae-5]|nr:MAG: hypothetical protein CVV49_09930 [Spirochaetae bacterium HGW-Spirochaetae-5]
MNISTGMSEINLSRAGANSPVSGKSYIWPKYIDAKVEKIKSPGPEERQPIYSKPDLAEREKLVSKMFQSEDQYDSYGRSDSRKPLITPGSFFDALA